MVSSGMLHRVALVRTDVSEELSASIIRVTRFGELGTTLSVTSNRRTLRRNTNWYFFAACIGCYLTASVVPSSPILVTLMKEALSSSERSVLTRATWCNIPEDTILHSHCRENPKSYILIRCFRNHQFSLMDAHWIQQINKIIYCNWKLHSVVV
jgi:hypothetical protein